MPVVSKKLRILAYDCSCSLLSMRFAQCPCKGRRDTPATCRSGSGSGINEIHAYLSLLTSWLHLEIIDSIRMAFHIFDDESKDLHHDDEKVSVDDHVAERVRVLRIVAEHQVRAVRATEPRDHGNDGDDCLG